MTPPPEPPHRAREEVVVAQFGGWRVLSDGTLANAQRCITIYGDRLGETDWWLNLSQRPWMAREWNDFIPAFRAACEVAQVQVVYLKMIVE